MVIGKLLLSKFLDEKNILLYCNTKLFSEMNSM